MDKKEKKSKIFYGWYILAVGIAGAFMAAGTSQLFMSIMLKPLTEEFEWSRTIATGAISTGTILAGLFSFPFGKLADRYGPRLLTSLGALVTVVVYVAIANLGGLWQFYVVYIIGRIVSTNTISNIVPKTAAVNWFRRFRGRALGLISMATPLGASSLAITAQLIMEHHGWRTVFLVFAFAMVFLQALPAALILRKQPEDLGLLPDGGPGLKATAGPAFQSPAEEEFSWRLNEALRTPTFWFLAVSVFIAPMVNAGIGFHLVAYYTDVGITATLAVGAMSIYALAGATGNAIWGFMSERVPERYLASAVMFLTAFSILYLQSARTTLAAFIFAVIFGLTSRGEDTLVNIILAQYYGRGSYGAISGFVFPINRLGLGFGPLISSATFDLLGSYQVVFIFFFILSIIIAILLWFAKKPTPPVRLYGRA